MKHTELPWAICNESPNEYWYEGTTIYDVNGQRRVADTPAQLLDAEANAAFIIKAVNNHYQLLDALKELYRNSESGARFLDKAEAAIKAAEEEQ